MPLVAAMDEFVPIDVVGSRCAKTSAARAPAAGLPCRSSPSTLQPWSPSRLQIASGEREVRRSSPRRRIPNLSVRTELSLNRAHPPRRFVS